MPQDDPLAPSLEGLARRQSGTQQWQSAIEQQRQRAERAPSMGQQVGDIVNFNIERALTGNPAAMIGQMYQDIRGGKLNPGTYQGAGRSARTALALLMEGMMAGQQGYGTGMRGRVGTPAGQGKLGMVELIDAWRKKQLPTDNFLGYVRVNRPELYEAIMNSAESTESLGEAPGLEQIIESVLARLDPRLKA